MKVGIGYDAHRFEQGRPLVLGGVTIPHKSGLAGHSDADVLLHAISDAILGALALGDIGKYFPPSNPEYKDMSSLLILKKSVVLAVGKGYAVNKKIAEVVGTPVENVSVKGTTTEGMGFAGRREGIAAQAVVTLSPVHRV
ncbi:MAG: 2-C-methyl-D-erythritol 2,4-cyclodiphosphate synthase [Nitrospinae bacterium]|nr:2-C-methyl-D-erythritol 2,4-cyclodiphosphate synthase [Nitrospinota bacterium]